MNKQVHTNKFTYRFEVEHVIGHEVKRIVYYTDLQYHLVYRSFTARIKELHLVDGSRFVIFIHPEMICMLIAGMDEFVMNHIFVPGSTPGATLAVDICNGTKYTFSESEGNRFKIIKSKIIVGVESYVGSITVPAVGYRLLRKGLEGAYKAWLRETQSGK